MNSSRKLRFGKEVEALPDFIPTPEEGQEVVYKDTKADFPPVGEVETLYVDNQKGIVYIWDAVSGNYVKEGGVQIQSDFNVFDQNDPAYIRNKPETFTRPFITKWNVVAGEPLELPLATTGAYVNDVVVDWGDGAVNKEYSHTYATTGIVTISIKGRIDSFSLYQLPVSKLKLTEVVQWGSNKWVRITFLGAVNLTALPIGEVPDFSDVVIMSITFRDTGLTTIPVGLFDKAKNVTNYNQCFKGSPIASIPTGLFDFSSSAVYFNETFMLTNVTHVPLLFDGAFNINSITGIFRGAPVTSIETGLFKNNRSLLDVSTAFYECQLTSIPFDIFINCYNITTFHECFRYNPLEGIVPPLWMWFPDATGTNCFQHATAADNWLDIPTDWGGTNLDPHRYEEPRSQFWNPVTDQPEWLIGGVWKAVAGGVFTDTENGLVPAPNSPTVKKVLKSTGWEDEKRAVKRIISNGDNIDYTLELGDREKWLNLRCVDNVTGYIKITIPSGVFENGDVIKGYNHFSDARNVKLKSDLNYLRYPSGVIDSNGEITPDGYFEIRITNTSSTGEINALSAVITGDFIKQYEVMESPNGTLYKVAVSDAGALTVTAL